VYLGTELAGKLSSLSQEDLPRFIGSKYTQIVQTCLTCLEPDNEDFGDDKDFEHEDGISVGVRYIQKVSASQHYIPALGLEIMLT
jgi:hypothetical protein